MEKFLYILCCFIVLLVANILFNIFLDVLKQLLNKIPYKNETKDIYAGVPLEKIENELHTDPDLSDGRLREIYKELGRRRGAYANELKDKVKAILISRVKN